MGGRGWLVTGGLIAVAVLIGDQKDTVSAGGGFITMHYGCTAGDVTAKFTSGLVVVPEPVCPEQQIVVYDGRVELQPASANGT